MAARNRIWLTPNIRNSERIMWYFGLQPRVLDIAGLAVAAAGWVLFRSPFGMLLGTIALILRWKTATLINSTYQERVREAEARVKDEGAVRLGVRLSASEIYVINSGRGTSPFGVRAKPEYDISVVYVSDAFFAIYAGASFGVAKLEIELPAKGEEIYFQHVSAISYHDPFIEIVLANGRTTRQFKVGTVGDANVLERLRTKLRSASQPVFRSTASTPSEAPVPQLSLPTPLAVVEAPNTLPLEETASGEEARYCYMRLNKLLQLYQDPVVLEALMEQLEVPGKYSVLKNLAEQEKHEAIETQIDHFRRTPTSVWYGVPTYEVLAASIWRAQEVFLPRRLVDRKSVV